MFKSSVAFHPPVVPVNGYEKPHQPGSSAELEDELTSASDRRGRHSQSTEQDMRVLESPKPTELHSPRDVSRSAASSQSKVRRNMFGRNTNSLGIPDSTCPQFVSMRCRFYRGGAESPLLQEINDDFLGLIAGCSEQSRLSPVGTILHCMAVTAGQKGRRAYQQQSGKQESFHSTFIISMRPHQAGGGPEPVFTDSGQ